ETEIQALYEAKAKLNYDDIRFADSNLAPLSYWKESDGNFWVKVPSIPNGTKTIYVYYGNSQATSDSNGDAVFEFFDDFEGTEVDTAKWNIIGTTSNISISGSLLDVYISEHIENGRIANGLVASSYEMPSGTIIEAKTKGDSTRRNHWVAVGATGDYGSIAPNWAYTEKGFTWYQNTSYDMITDSYSASRDYTTTSVTYSKWHEYRIDYIDSNTLKFYIDGTLKATHTGDSVPSTSRKPELGGDDFSDVNYHIKYDWIRVRKYTSTEPTASVGSEESTLWNGSANASVSGKIHKAVNFDGSDDYVKVNLSKQSAPFTKELWAKRTGDNNYDLTFVGLLGWRYITESLQGIVLGSGDTIYFHDYKGTPSYISANVSMTLNQWYHIVVTHDGSNLNIYVNGELKNSTSQTLSSYSSSELQIGGIVWRTGQNRVFNGIIDSVRISNTARSAAWIQTEYNNQNDPEDFYSLGPEENYSASALSSWSYRKKITIDHGMIPSTLKDFPVLINLPADADLAAKARTDGNDIIFVPSSIGWSSGTSNDRYCFEIEKYDSSTGELVAWVKIPKLSSTADTDIYLYYGNSSQTTGLEDPCTWDSHYVMVQHLEESPSNGVAGHYDSTSHGNDGTPYYFDNNADSTTNAIGKINGADLFDGTNDKVIVSQSTSLNTILSQHKLTYEAWIYQEDSSGNQDIVGFNGYNPYWGYTLNLSSGKPGLRWQDSAGAWHYKYSTSAVSINQWSHVVVTYDASANQLSVYINGQFQTFSENATTDNTGSPLYIGHVGWKAFNGIIDEVRISDINRSTEWIQTSYLNMNDPEAFYTLWPEQHYSSTNLSSWLYRKKITIDHGMIAADLNDFPVLINLPADSDLAARARSDGNDIIFVPSSISWSTGTSNDRYCFEIEKYDSSTGELVAWVKIPKLSSTEDTNIYLYYGNSSQTSSLENKCTWDSHYVMVQHLEESPSNGVAGHYDSTSRRNDGTPKDFNGEATSTTDGAGKVDGADVFDGNNDYVGAGNVVETENQLTVEAWIKPMSTSGTDYFIGEGASFRVGINDVGNVTCWHRGDDSEGIDTKDSTTTTTTPISSMNKWYLITCVWDGAIGDRKIYVNGTLEADGSTNV
ncbi:hypothetical protein DRO69_11410, partial [Candidatus Bathyarchaeota archaeon]